MQDEIAASAYAFQRDVESGKRIIVGMNRFTVEEDRKTPVMHIDDSIRTVQMQKLAALKGSRDAGKAAACLARIGEAARGTENLMPHVVDAVENLCTLGEISDELRKVFGEYR